VQGRIGAMHNFSFFIFHSIAPRHGIVQRCGVYELGRVIILCKGRDCHVNRSRNNAGDC
jgi:hypothetical protein